MLKSPFTMNLRQVRSFSVSSCLFVYVRLFVNIIAKDCLQQYVSNDNYFRQCLQLFTVLHFETQQYDITLPPGPKGKHICGTTTINERGQVVIPKQARDLLKLQKGDDLIVFMDEAEGLALVKRDIFEANLEKIQNMVHETPE